MRFFCSITFLVLVLMTANGVQAQWLDGKTVRQWSKAGQTLPEAPKSEFAEVNDNGKNMLSPASLPVDNILTAAGWDLVGAVQVYGDLLLPVANFNSLARY